ncbi:NAD-dependent epimerase/dehydratase family protein [Neorhizobium sp. DAR64861/K0K2]|uniref:NAD-dependent epimerase/dehydratase family protein n=1 Tax=unclassified Neorhizobium TaxID=2629175 RepID=UPI003D2AF124
MPSEMGRKIVLVTGATGRIGKVVVDDLLERGYSVRAVTSNPRTRAESQGSERVQWRHFDLLRDTDFDSLVAGCVGVIHLAAVLGDMAKMKAVNVDATRMLAEASERHNVSAFCYTSSVSVYGSGRRRHVDEKSPTLTVQRDDASEYLALDYVRMYGRTKLEGEMVLKDTARAVRYVIVRPTVVVSVDDLISIRAWPLSKRLFGAHRHAHHLYVKDLSDALVWFLERGLSGKLKQGLVDTFNIAEDDYARPRHIDFMRRAYAASHDQRFRSIALPGVFDWARDIMRLRRLSLRNPLWRMRFSTAKLAATGYRFRFGMAYAEQQAIDRLSVESRASNTPSASLENPTTA